MRITAKTSVWLALFLVSSITSAQVTSPSQVPSGYILQPEGTVERARIVSVAIKTVSDIGPFTAFLVLPPETGARPEWFYIRNDNSVKGMERGAMIGLLMGAAEAWHWGENYQATVDIQYHTVGDRKEIVNAGFGGAFRR